MFIEETLMQTILIVSLLLGGYLYLVKVLAAFSDRDSQEGAVALLVFFPYAGVSAVLYFFFLQTGLSLLLVFLVFCVLLACLVGAFFYVKNNRDYMNVGMAILFVLYFLMVLYITLISRQFVPHDDSLKVIPFHSFAEAIEAFSVEPLEHFGMNMVLFMPLGFLFAMTDREVLGKKRNAFILGLLCTSLIESSQYILVMGQPDIDDILANTFGAVVGCLVARFLPLGEEPEEDEEGV